MTPLRMVVGFFSHDVRLQLCRVVRGMDYTYHASQALVSTAGLIRCDGSVSYVWKAKAQPTADKQGRHGHSFVSRRFILDFVFIASC